MIKFLPIILIPVLLLAGLGYWRYQTSKNLSTPQSEASQTETPLEVPKTLPQGSLEDRVKDLEKLITKLAAEVSKLKSPAPKESQDPKLNSLDAAVTELKVKVANLQAATPVPQASSSKPVAYIPLGSGGGPWTDQSWNTLNEYQVSIDPNDYPGYTSMQLEANFRLIEAAGTASVRLYNVTDATSLLSQIDTTSTGFSVQSSGSFKLAAGRKTYTLQVQSSQSKSLFVQNARLKVNF